jgi:hypothetical protein
MADLTLITMDDTTYMTMGGISMRFQLKEPPELIPTETVLKTLRDETERAGGTAMVASVGTKLTPVYAYAESCTGKSKAYAVFSPACTRRIKYHNKNKNTRYELDISAPDLVFIVLIAGNVISNMHVMRVEEDSTGKAYVDTAALPNIHGGGMVCMGHNFSVGVDRSLDAKLNAVITHYWESTFNGDIQLDLSFIPTLHRECVRDLQKDDAWKAFAEKTMEMQGNALFTNSDGTSYWRSAKDTLENKMRSILR